MNPVREKTITPPIQPINICFPNVFGNLNKAHESDYDVRMFRTKCSLVLLDINGAYGAGGKYEYRLGGNGQIDEDAVTAIVVNLKTILFFHSKIKETDVNTYKYVFGNDGQHEAPNLGISNVTYKFENGDWYIEFEFTGFLLEAEYIIKLSKERTL